MYQRYRAQVAFLVVYVQEAHPTDGWQVESNVADDVLLRQHQSYDEREQAAATCSLNLQLALPIVVEEMDNAIDEAYGAAPERLYLIGRDGRVAYHGGAARTFLIWRRGSAPSWPSESPRISMRLDVDGNNFDSVSFLIAEESIRRAWLTP